MVGALVVVGDLVVGGEVVVGRRAVVGGVEVAGRRVVVGGAGRSVVCGVNPVLLVWLGDWSAVEDGVDGTVLVVTGGAVAELAGTDVVATPVVVVNPVVVVVLAGGLAGRPNHPTPKPISPNSTETAMTTEIQNSIRGFLGPFAGATWLRASASAAGMSWARA